ncbi:MAG: YlbF family regulator [Candidatus Paceibacterota bacterium]
MDDLDKKTEEFCLAVEGTKEYREFKAAAEVYGGDKEAQKLLNDFQMAQQELAILQDGDFSGAAEQEEKFEKLLDEVRKNEAINNWIDSQKKLAILTGGLATAITGRLGFPFTLPPKKSCGCG